LKGEYQHAEIKYINIGIPTYCGLIVGESFAQGTVYVDVKQTSPTNSSGAVQVRVGKNVNATYLATAKYNGQPTLHKEEKIQSTAWKYSVSTDNKVVYNPQSGDVNSVTVSAKSAEAGTYTVTFTFKVTFTIKTPVVDSQGKYQYDSNDNQKFTKGVDTILHSHRPYDHGEGKKTWRIPFEYYNNEDKHTSILTNTQEAIFDGKGRCTSSKFGEKATYGPKNVQKLLGFIREGISYRYLDGWEYK
jgi:hypothetical protein